MSSGWLRHAVICITLRPLRTVERPTVRRVLHRPYEGEKRVSEAIDQGGKRVSKGIDLVVTTIHDDRFAAPSPPNSPRPHPWDPKSELRTLTPVAPSSPAPGTRSAVYNTKLLAEVRLDKQVNGKCSECRLVFDVLDSCLACGQMLCNKCLLQGFHASCIAYVRLSLSTTRRLCPALSSSTVPISVVVPMPTSIWRSLSAARRSRSAKRQGAA